MINEEKELLLKDLCGRLPYGVKGEYQWKGNAPYDRELDGHLYDELRLSFHSTEDSSFMPYLRPMSSMTEEEEKDYVLLSNHCIITSIGFVCIEAQILIDWLNAHHFDYRGLIEKGLALEAPEGMYKKDK